MLMLCPSAKFIYAKKTYVLIPSNLWLELLLGNKILVFDIIISLYKILFDLIGRNLFSKQGIIWILGLLVSMCIKSLHVWWSNVEKYLTWMARIESPWLSRFLSTKFLELESHDGRKEVRSWNSITLLFASFGGARRSHHFRDFQWQKLKSMAKGLGCIERKKQAWVRWRNLDKADTKGGRRC